MNKLILALLALYQAVFSPVAGFFGAQCRFYPSCSEYARLAFKKLAFWKAFRLTAARLIKCGPWCEGGIDTI